MPDLLNSPFDKIHRPRVKPVDQPLVPGALENVTYEFDNVKLPRSGIQAALRGARNCCPNCENVRLFARFLKPVDRCSACGQDWTAHQADDFPAYIAILLTGHLMAPVLIILATQTNLPMLGMMALILTLATAIMMTLLQPAKGAIIAIQWWLGMHDFVKPDRHSSESAVPPKPED